MTRNVRWLTHFASETSYSAKNARPIEILAVQRHDAQLSRTGVVMAAELTERHEIRVRAGESTIVFTAESEDGRLFIRQEPDAGKGRNVCSIALSDLEPVS